MKKSIILTFATLSAMIPLTSPVMANSHHFVNKSSSHYHQEITLNKSTAFTVGFSQPIQFEASQGKTSPITALLAQPVVDSIGNVIIPQNSPITTRLVSTEQGVRIVAESVVIGSQALPIHAVSPILAETKVTITQAPQQKRKGKMLGSLGGSIASFFGDSDNKSEKNDTMMQGMLGGNALGILVELGAETPQEKSVVQIPQGSVHILTLEAPMSLPNYGTAQQSANTQQSRNAPASSQVNY